LLPDVFLWATVPKSAAAGALFHIQLKKLTSLPRLASYI